MGDFPPLTPGEENVLLHTLGLDYGKVPYRNMFLAGPGHHDMPHIEGLVQKGLMRESQHANGGIYYVATHEGSHVAFQVQYEKEKLLPKLTRSQARYQRYLSADTGDTFIQYLLSRGKRA